MRSHRLLATAVAGTMLATMVATVSSADTVTAVDDAYNAVVDTPLVVDAPGVLANDSGTGTLSLINDPANGTVSLAQDGSFTYTPDPGFEGVDTFVYELASATPQSPIDVGSAQSLDTGTMGGVRLGDLVLFTASTSATGRELWRTDGTEAGTELVKDIRFGTGDGITWSDAPVVIGDFAYFYANDGAAGFEVWRSDGTEAGTTPVTDLSSGSASSFPLDFVANDGKLYFTATTSGSPPPTARVPFVYNPATGSVTQLVSDFSDTEQRFAATTGIVGTSQGALFDAYGNIWRADAAGAVEIWDGSDEPEPDPLTAYFDDTATVGGVAFFGVGDPLSGDRQLWRSDGSALQPVFDGNWTLLGTTDTHVFAGLAPELRAVSPDGTWTSLGTYYPEFQETGNENLAFEALGSLAFIAMTDTFGASADVWVSDGTVAGTSLLVDSLGSFEQFNFATGNGEMWFTAVTNINTGLATLYHSDGTTTETAPYLDPMEYFPFGKPIDGGAYLLVPSFDLSRVNPWAVPYELGNSSQATVTINVQQSISIDVSETITVYDTPFGEILPEAISIVVEEVIGVLDEVAINLGLPPISITVTEDITVSDEPVVDFGPPPLQITVVETIVVSDEPTVTFGLAPIRITVSESIVVSDAVDVSVDDSVVCTVTGTSGADVLFGTRSADVICGLGGGDIIFALGGDDVVITGDADDVVFLGAGNDVADVGGGDDLVWGSGGSDEIRGGAGADTLLGGRGADAIFGEGGDDFIWGGPGNDVLDGGPGDDIVWQ